MYKIKIISSIFIFSILLAFTSVIKTQTRIVEKNIYKSERTMAILEKDLHETQLDYSYLSSPSHLSQKIKELAYVEYLPMDLSKIYFNYLDFTNDQKKISIIKKNYEKKIQKK